MEQEHFAQFEKDTEEHRKRVQKVCEITLSPNANTREYILATIDTLNTHLGRPVTRPELDSTVLDVVKYRLWDADNDETLNQPLPVIRSVGSVHTEVIYTLGHLSQNGWISLHGSIELTDSGREMLAEFMPATESVKN